MGETFKPGVKLFSAVCKTQIMALRVPDSAFEVTCGGLPMLASDPEQFSTASGQMDGTLVGKRYVDDSDSMEFLCTRGGDGTVAVNGTVLIIKQAKQLPSSD